MGFFANSAYAYHSELDNKPCIISVAPHYHPATMDGAPRNNPDWTFYPGDAFYFLFKFSASSTCLSLSIGALESDGAIDVLSHDIISWRNYGKSWMPSVVNNQFAEGDPILRKSVHNHKSHDIVLEYLKTTHYHQILDSNTTCKGKRGGGKVCNTSYTLAEKSSFSVREDEKLSYGQIRELQNSYKAYGTKSTHAWDFTRVNENHQHYEKIYEFEDKESVNNFENHIKQQCGRLEIYSGCIFGYAKISVEPETRKCLLDEISKIGASHEYTQEDDYCTNLTFELINSFTGKKRTCPEHDECETIIVKKTASLNPKVLEPNLSLVLTKELIKDEDEFLSGNDDGTYYLWDALNIVHHPQYLWQNDRVGTLSVKVTKNHDLEISEEFQCEEATCEHIITHNAISPYQKKYDFGQGTSIFNATTEKDLGIHDFEYKVELYNLGRLINSTESKTNALIVQYSPIFDSRSYTLLKDDQKTAFEKRAAFALRYHGSIGGNIDDIEGIHIQRRAIINDYNAPTFAINRTVSILLDETPIWAGSETSSVNATGEFTQRTKHFESSSEAAIFREAGYGKVFLFSNIRDIVWDNHYFNVTTYNTLISDQFGGKEKTHLTFDEYRYPENLFTAKVNVAAVDANNTITHDKEISLKITPNTDLGAAYVTDYINDKIFYDTGDQGFASLITNDTYPTTLEQTGKGNVTMKTRLTSTLFPDFGNIIEVDLPENHTEYEMFKAYYENTEKIKWDIPIDIGLTAQSPYLFEVTYDGITQIKEWQFFDQSALDTIFINSDSENILDASRFRSILSISPSETYDQITEVWINGEIQDVSCVAGCSIPVDPYDKLEVVTKNYWGGTSSRTIAEVEKPEAVTPSNSVIELLIFGSVFVIGGLIFYKKALPQIQGFLGEKN